MQLKTLPKPFPVIDPIATGENILRLRMLRGISVREMQLYFGFESPQAIYKWQHGHSLPSVDNLYALSALLEVPMEQILVPALFTTALTTSNLSEFTENGRQDVSCRPALFPLFYFNCSSMARQPSSICA